MTSAPLTRALGPFALLGGAVPYVVRSIERAMTFNPTRFDPSKPWTLPAGTRDLWFNTEDGLQLHGWLLDAAPGPRRGPLLYFHGNGGYLPTYLPALERLRGHGFDVLAFDYRGYGRSDGEPRDETALYRDGDAAVRAFADALGVASSEMIFYGHSLGTTVAAEMALRHRCRALVLQAPIASLAHQLSCSMPMLPGFLAGMTINKFDTVRKIAELAAPLLVMHGEKDETIRVAQGLAVYAAAPDPKRLKLYPEGGHILGESTGWSHLSEVVDFVQSLQKPRGVPSASA